MDSLYARCEQIFTSKLISTIQHNRLVLALSEVTKLVAKSDIPNGLQPCILTRALQILRDIENQKQVLDIGFARCIPHPLCGKRNLTLGELWELPLQLEWLCSECGRPLYDITENREDGEVE